MIRSKWIWVVLSVLAVLVVLIVVWIAPAIRLAAATPVERERILASREGIPLEPEDLQPHPAIPDSQNAAGAYRAAFAAFKADRAEPRESILRLASGRFRTDDARSVRAYLRRHARDLESVDRASRLPSCDFHYEWAKGPDLLFPECASAREVALILAARSVIQSRDGKPDVAFASLATGARLARHFGRIPTLVPTLVDVAIQSILDRAWYVVLKEHSGESEVLSSAAGPCTEFVPPDAVGCLASEAALSRVVYTELRQGKDPDHPEAKPVTPSKEQLARIDDAEMQMLAFWRRVVHGMRQSKDDPLAAYQTVKRECDEIEADSNRQDTYLLRIMVPVYRRACLKLTAAAAQGDLRNTTLALLQHRQRTGRYPDRLADLHPAPPRDPLSNAPLHYHPTRNGFVLYSVGENLLDDGGKGGGKPPADIVVSFP